MIRRAVIADCNRAVELLQASHAAAGFDRLDGPSGFYVPFEERYAMRLFLAHLTTPRMLALVFEFGAVPQGLLLAAASEHPFGPVWIARETVWWIDPGHRRGLTASRMLDQYELWAHDVGCVYSGMAGMGDDPEVAKLYVRRGYRPAEKHFLKVL